MITTNGTCKRGKKSLHEKYGFLLIFFHFPLVRTRFVFISILKCNLVKYPFPWVSFYALSTSKDHFITLEAKYYLYSAEVFVCFYFSGML